MSTNTTDSAVPPVPNLQEIVEQREGSNKVSIPWMQWFVQLREKVNILNSSIVNLAGVTGTGFLSKDGANWFLRTFTGTIGRISISNGTGAGGDPQIDLVDTSVTPGSYVNTNLTVGADGRITAASNGSAGAGGMISVASTTVTGAAVTTMSISGLDLATDNCYYILFQIKNATASAAQINLFYNSDTTTTNYFTQVLSVNNTSVSGARGNNSVISAMDANTGVSATLTIVTGYDGRPRATVLSNRTNVTNTLMQNFTHGYVTIGNVTDIALTSSVANSMDIGSYLKIYKIP